MSPSSEIVSEKFRDWCRPNVSRAARLLGVNFPTLYAQISSSRPVRLCDFVKACEHQVENEGRSELLEGLILELRPLPSSPSLGVELEAKLVLKEAAEQVQRRVEVLDDNRISAEEAALELPHFTDALSTLAQFVDELADRAREQVL